jgi:hypothetical protein
VNSFATGLYHDMMPCHRSKAAGTMGHELKGERRGRGEGRGRKRGKGKGETSYSKF